MLCIGHRNWQTNEIISRADEYGISGPGHWPRHGYRQTASVALLVHQRGNTLPPPPLMPLTTVCLLEGTPCPPPPLTTVCLLKKTPFPHFPNALDHSLFAQGSTLSPSQYP